jgi:hypothetical protein
MKKRFHFLVTLPAVLLLGSALFLLFLPYLFNLYLFPRLINELPFREKELSISKISPWEIRGTVTLADVDHPTLSIPKFELHYTPGSLFQRRIDEILLDSASLQIEMHDGRPVIRGLPEGDASKNQKEKTASFLLPVAVENIILKNCVITFLSNFQEPIIVILNGRFSLDFLEQPENMKLLSSLSGQIQLRGALALSSKIDLKSVNNEYKLQLQLQVPDIGQFATLVPGLKDTWLTGALSLSTLINFDPSSQLISGYEAIVTLPHFQFRKNNFIFATNSTEKPVSLRLAGNLETIQYTLANIVLTEPEKAHLDLKGEMKIPAKTFNGVGTIFFEKLNSSLAIHLDGDHQQAKTSISYKLASDAFELGDAFSVSSCTADGNITIDGASVDATLNGHIPELTLQKSKTTLVNLSLQLPFHYPAPAKDTVGKLKIEKIRYQGVNSGSLNATISPSPEKIAFTTLLTTPFVPGLQLSCDGSAQMSGDVESHCRIPETRFNSASLPSFISLPKGLSFNGKFAAVAAFQISDNIPSGNLKIDYRKGTLSQGENKLSDINFSIVFPHLPLLQSSPSQLCTIGALDLGKIKMSDARIRFRIEEDQSLFLEKSRLSWCGGKVETGSFALSKGMKEFETTLYCDRLGFTQLLGQFGIDKAEGKGSLNGRIPLLIGKKGLVFDDGFLFSTPGNSGIVRFNDTKQLRQGIPDIDKSAYLDYSMKSLGNFAYNWTKLSFNSQGDDLLIAMQLDGKPAEPLPFGYKNGQIVPSNKGPGLQHPIRLDVNFRLPLQDLFQYGKNIQSIMENM